MWDLNEFIKVRKVQVEALVKSYPHFKELENSVYYSNEFYDLDISDKRLGVVGNDWMEVWGKTYNLVDSTYQEYSHHLVFLKESGLTSSIFKAPLENKQLEIQRSLSTTSKEWSKLKQHQELRPLVDKVLGLCKQPVVARLFYQDLEAVFGNP